MKNATKEKLYSVLHDVLGTSITPGLTMDDVPSWDSLRHIQLLAKLEEVFGVEFEFQDTLAMTSVRAITETVDRYVGKA